MNAPQDSAAGNCDTVELAREFGTPCFVVAEDDIRARARAFVQAFAARTNDFEVVFASKAFPCTAVYRLLWDEGNTFNAARQLSVAGVYRPRRLLV